MAHHANDVHVIVRVPYPRPTSTTATAAVAAVPWTPERDQRLLLLMDTWRVDGQDEPDWDAIARELGTSAEGCSKRAVQLLLQRVTRENPAPGVARERQRSVPGGPGRPSQEPGSGSPSVSAAASSVDSGRPRHDQPQQQPAALPTAVAVADVEDDGRSSSVGDVGPGVVHEGGVGADSGSEEAETDALQAESRASESSDRLFAGASVTRSALEDAFLSMGLGGPDPPDPGQAAEAAKDDA